MGNIFRGLFVGIIILVSLVLIILIQIDSPVIDMPHFFQSIFVKNTPMSNIIYNISSGIFASGIFYIFLVYIPEYKKQKKVAIEVSKALKFIVSDCSIFLMILYKNCSFDFEWKRVNRSNDDILFNRDFLEKLARLDLYKSSDTMYKKNSEDTNSITYNDYISSVMEDYVNVIDTLLENYIAYMDNKVITLCSNLKHNRLFSMYLGINNDTHITVCSDSSGNKYLNKVTLHQMYASPKSKLDLVFLKDENNDTLKDFVSKFKVVREYVVKKDNNYRDIATRYVFDHAVGRTEIGIFYSKEMLEVLKDIDNNNFSEKNMMKYGLDNSSVAQIIKYLSKHGYISAIISTSNGKENIRIEKIQDKGRKMLANWRGI